MVLISQDRLKAIPAENIKFFTISPDPDKNGKFMLFAKPPTHRNDYYDYLILFEHENLNVVKEVMLFLANGIWLIPHDDDNQNLLVVDLPDLYKHGMKTRDFNNEHFEGDTMQPIIGKIEQLTNRLSPPSGGSGVPDKPCLDLSKLDEAQQKADKLKATLLEIQELSKTILDDFFSIHEKTFEKFWDYHSKRHEEIKHEIEANQERIRRWRS